MNTNLTDTDRADLARFLREAIEADRYPFSPRVRRLKELLAKIDPTPAPVVSPYPALRRSERPEPRAGEEAAAVITKTREKNDVVQR
jgi:hypothetical protein